MIELAAGFHGTENPLEIFKGLFVVNAIRRTRLVEVNFDWPDPQEGARILDYHVRQYVADYNRRKRESADVVLAGLQRQRDQFAPQVEKARSDLQAFKEQHNVIAFEQNQDTVTEDLRARAQAVSESREELSVISARLEQIESAVKNHTPVENLPDNDTGQRWFIVSRMVFEAAPERSDLLAPDTGPSAVRDESGRILGVTQFVAR